MNFYIENLDEAEAQLKNLRINQWQLELLEYWKKVGKPLPSAIQNLAERDLNYLIRARHVATGRNEDYRLAELAQDNNFRPLWLEYQDDIFVSVSKPKLSLLYLQDQVGHRHKMTNPSIWERQSLSKISFLDGQRMVDFHHRLWKKIPGQKMMLDVSKWLQGFGTAKDYYFAEMSLYTGFGLLAADFHNKGKLSSGKALSFTEEIVEPAVQQVQKYFGLKPLIYQFSYQEGDEYYPQLPEEIQNVSRWHIATTLAGVVVWAKITKGFSLLLSKYQIFFDILSECYKIKLWKQK